MSDNHDMSRRIPDYINYLYIHLSHQCPSYWNKSLPVVLDGIINQMARGGNTQTNI